MVLARSVSAYFLRNYASVEFLDREDHVPDYVPVLVSDSVLLSQKADIVAHCSFVSA